MSGRDFDSFMDGVFIGLAIMFAVFFIIDLSTSQPINLSQETGDDVCFQLTGNESVVADSLNGKLYCETPSFDSTQNIIIKENSD